jgi:hypothetical protein
MGDTGCCKLWVIQGTTAVDCRVHQSSPSALTETPLPVGCFKACKLGMRAVAARVHQYVDFRAAYCPKYVKVRTSTRIGGVRGCSTCLCLAVKRTALSLTCKTTKRHPRGPTP